MFGVIRRSAIVGDSGDLTTATLATDLQDFANHTADISAAVTPANADFTVQVRPGIDISSSGDLTVGSVLDLNALATNSSAVVRPSTSRCAPRAIS